ncbi:MAG: mechanosensitive ion channel family protein [Candidatus Neomarinimicrobiota bacterium]
MAALLTFGITMSLLDTLQQDLLGIPLVRYVVAFLVVLVTLVVRLVVDRYLFRLLGGLANRSRFRYDELALAAVRRPVGAFLLVWGVYFALGVFTVSPDAGGRLLPLFRGATALIVVWGLYRLSDLPTQWAQSALARRDETLATQFAPLIRRALRVTIVLLGALLIIQNLGYSVSSLLAGLGIGGLAIALAGQDTIANLFGSLVVLTDRPMVIGDRVQIGDVQGTVESIGFRSTRIRTFEKSLVAIPNKMLAAETIENWSAQPGRRVRMTVGVQYDSPPDKLQSLLDAMRAILAGNDEIDPEGQYVHFVNFGPSSLDILVNYVTKTTDYQEHLQVREQINLAMMAKVESLGLAFAFPSTTVYFGEPPPGPTSTTSTA